MKILFLDIDGVVNCSSTKERHRGFIGIDPEKAKMIQDILKRTETNVVLSSTWRLDALSRAEVKEKVCPCIDVTPHMPIPGGVEACERGKEIARWLSDHPEVTRYAILDDDSDMLDEQLPSFFKTTWQEGLTENIAKKVEEHLNK